MTVTSAPSWRAEAANSADPAGADDGHVALRLQAPAQRVAVRERAQVVDPVELGAGNRQPARLRAGGQQQPVVAELSPVLQRDSRSTGVERGYDGVGDQLDVVLAIESLGM